MFIDFFYHLRSRGLSIGVGEWLAVLEALNQGLAFESLERFYVVCRALCVKSEGKYDLYDRAFAEYFRGVEFPQELEAQVLEWLKSPTFNRTLSEEERARFEALDLDELKRKFEERLKEQDERHDGGSHWVGTGGRSAFGAGGAHPTGIRVGPHGGGRSAAQVAEARRFRNLRNDLTLDIRQIQTALRQLRLLAREGRPDELDLDESIDATAKNAGDIELVFRPQRKNTVKLLLLMDVGGSMSPFTRLSEQLFSAAHKATHFKAFKFFYFHNCIYEGLYTDIERSKTRPTLDILEELDRSWYCVIVGDAAMHPYELLAKGGSIEYFHNNDEAGITWLQRIKKRLPRTIWINPEPQQYWNMTTIQEVRRVFDMYPMTLEGLSRGVRRLRHIPL